MKKFFLLLATLLLALMSADAQYIYRTRRLIYGNPANEGNPRARQIMASESIKSYRDPNTNAIVYASTTEDYTFNVVFGTVKLVNTPTDSIEVYFYQDKTWKKQESIYRYGPFQDIETHTKQQPQLITFAKGSNGRVFAIVYSTVRRENQTVKWARLASYTF